MFRKRSVMLVNQYLVQVGLLIGFEHSFGTKFVVSDAETLHGSVCGTRPSSAIVAAKRTRVLPSSCFLLACFSMALVVQFAPEVQAQEKEAAEITAQDAASKKAENSTAPEASRTKEAEGSTKEALNVSTKTTQEGKSPNIGAEQATAEPPPTFKIAGSTSARIQKYTGLTWLTEKGMGLSASLAAKLMLGGSPSIKFKAYSFTDALSGKFKKVSVDLKNSSYKKIPLGNIQASTSMPIQFRLFNSKNGKAGVATPVMVAVSGQVSEEQVSKALQSPTISSSLGFLRLSLPGLGDQHLQVQEPKVKLENGLVKINTWLITANAAKETGVQLDISAKPILDRERFINLSDTKVDSKDIVEPEKFSVFSQELLNPLLDFGKFDRTTHAFRLNRLNVVDKKVDFAGKLLLAPRTVPPVNKTATPTNK